MSYKTVLVHVDESKNVDTRVRIAASLAAMEEGHLVGVASTGVSRYVYESMMAGMDAPLVAGYFDSLQERTGRAIKHFEDTVKGLGLRSFESRPAVDEPAGGLSLQARYADLCVLGQFDPSEPVQSTFANLPEYVAINGGSPVLVVPYAHQKETIGERCLVAWNGSLEAKRAIHFAIPLLRRAASVDLVVFKSENLADLSGEQPGIDIASFLARHGVRANVMEQDTDKDIGKALLSLAADRGADTLVMGCYGRSRFREILLGGATRTVLGSMTIPVFMAH
jgi:nucleotide-binding universal stress UspA family protein